MGDIKTVALQGARRSGRPLGWFFAVSALGAAGMLLSLSAPWGALSPKAYLPGLAALIGWLVCAAAGYLPPAAGWALRLLPWAAVLLLGPAELWRGLLLWLNCIIQSWNTLHEGGVRLFAVEATARSVRIVSLAAGIACGQAAWRAVSRRRMLLAGVLGAALMAMQLVCGTFSPLGCALLLASELMLWMCVPEHAPSAAAFRLGLACLTVLCVLALLLPQTRLSTVERLRKDAKETVHTLRYGASTLPEGDLARAAMLGQGEDTQLIVTSGQEKTLYLRAFIGDRYANGVWSPLPDAAYTGRYDGMLDWLQEQGFDPLEQPAAYYALTGGEDAPEENRVTVETVGASRAYLYAPSSTQALLHVRETAEHDTRFVPGGLSGASVYSLTERSSAQPAELTVTAQWVSAPQNEAQQRYSVAEAVYRTFVYDTYTTPAPELEDALVAQFWQDHAPEHDSVYQAVCHVRDCLTARQNDPDAAQDDPIGAFLARDTSGSAALYASAAAQALRAHGIPARYVEGYRLAADTLARSPDGTAALTGADTHAWCEVYFDGVGWLPVDFTPGYYYDARTLEQLIAAPESVQKTAALEQNAAQEELADIPSVSTASAADILAQAGRGLLIVLGVAAALVILLTIILLGLELARLVVLGHERAAFRRAGGAEQARFLSRRIFLLLRLRGFDATLGWRAEQTDAVISSSLASIEPGEYCRAAELMEKSLYGGQELEQFELRALQRFADRLADVRGIGLGATYWYVRYACMPWRRNGAQPHPRRKTPKTA